MYLLYSLFEKRAESAAFFEKAHSYAIYHVIVDYPFFEWYFCLGNSSHGVHGFCGGSDLDAFCVFNEFQ